MQTIARLALSSYRAGWQLPSIQQAACNLHLVRRNTSEAVRQVIQGQYAGPAAATPIAQQPSKARQLATTFFRIFLPVSGVGCLVYAFTHPDQEPLVPTKLPPDVQYLAAQQAENQETIVNWSGTHEAKPKRLFQPESEAEVEGFLKAANRAGQQLRVMGSALSPNGLSLSNEGSLSMALMDKIIAVDVEKQQVTVQAGCRIQQLADALIPYGLTLQNYASIREQQVGGFIQVGAHGTGATIPPVDDQVVALKLATPNFGTLQLSKTNEPELFSMAKVGLGALGVVTQVTLQAVPRHQLLERTFTSNMAEVKQNHVRWLKENRHLRYMWLPYTDTVVVVASNPVDEKTSRGGSPPATAAGQSLTEVEKARPFRDLYCSKTGAQPFEAEGLSAFQLRDALLALDPGNKDWVASVNKAEAEYWKRSSGVRVGWSDEILGFDCGGQQWVLETCFPIGHLDSLKGKTKDIEYMEVLLDEIKKNKIPAPCPIEQRWTAGSSSAMSPAAGPPDSVHSWVGIIMYLPDEPEARKRITEAFRKYAQLVQDKMMPRFDATWHWAKLELPNSETGLQKLRAKLASRFPVAQFNSFRALLDPQNILSNEWLNKLFPRSS